MPQNKAVKQSSQATTNIIDVPRNIHSTIAAMLLSLMGNSVPSPTPNFQASFDPKQFASSLANVANVPPSRPRDQNGIDVYGELPYMKKAYQLTDNGKKFNGTAEAAYSILRKVDGSFVRTPTSVDGDRRNVFKVPTNAFAVVHTHPVKADPTPGPNDANMSFPNYVYSGKGLYVTVPHTDKYYKYDIDKWNTK